MEFEHLWSSSKYFRSTVSTVPSNSSSIFLPSRVIILFLPEVWNLLRLILLYVYILFHFYGYILYFTFLFHKILKYFWIFVSHNGGENDEWNVWTGRDFFNTEFWEIIFFLLTVCFLFLLLYSKPVSFNLSKLWISWLGYGKIYISS